MLAIFKREFRNFFHNVIGWVFIATVVFVASLYFRYYNLSMGASNLLYMYINLLTIMVFALPILAMRVLPEERKQKTDQLILTSPISVGKIVVGKYLAMFAVLAISTAVVGSYIFIIRISVSVDWPLNLMCILGFLLYCGACLSICMFASSFFESQVVSSIVCIGVLFLIRLLSAIISLFGASENKILILIEKIINAIDLSARYDTLLNGVFDIKVIVFFVSVIVLFLFLTTQSIQKRRYTVSVKNLDLGAFSIIMIAVVVAVVVVLNLVMKKIPAKYTEFDCTNNKLFELSDTTENIVKNLDQNIRIYVYVNENQKDSTIDRILNKYTALSNKISVIYKDPDKSPMFYKNYTDENVYYNSLFIESDSKNRYVAADKMIIQQQTYDENYNVITEIQYDIEGQVTSAINYCISNEPDAHAYYTVGHGEFNVESRFLDQIEKQNIEYSEVNLLGAELPKDCEFLVINSPQTDFNESDTNKVIDYAKNGGKLMIILPIADDIATNMPNFKKILDVYGVDPVEGIISDETLYDSQPIYPILLPIDSEYTYGVTDSNKYVFAPIATGLTYNEEDDTKTYIDILTTSDNAVTKTNLNEATSYGYEQGDINGPFVVGVYCKAYYDTTFSEGFIFGSTNMFADMADQVSSGANSTIFLNCINKCKSENATTINIPAKSGNQEEIYTMNDATSLVLFLALWILLPLVFVITGVIIWRMRSKK